MDATTGSNTATIMYGTVGAGIDMTADVNNTLNVIESVGFNGYDATYGGVPGLETLISVASWNQITGDVNLTATENNSATFDTADVDGSVTLIADIANALSISGGSFRWFTIQPEWLN